MQKWLGNMFKAFLAPHPDPGVILGYAWHSQSSQIKPILMLSMADWYLKAEHYLQVQVIVICEAKDTANHFIRSALWRLALLGALYQ